MGVVESNDGGSARVYQDFAPIAVEVIEADTPGGWSYMVLRNRA
jgi:hypothetical protein